MGRDFPEKSTGKDTHVLSQAQIDDFITQTSGLMEGWNYDCIVYQTSDKARAVGMRGNDPAAACCQWMDGENNKDL